MTHLANWLPSVCCMKITVAEREFRFMICWKYLQGYLMAFSTKKTQRNNKKFMFLMSFSERARERSDYLLLFNSEVEFVWPHHFLAWENARIYAWWILCGFVVFFFLWPKLFWMRTENVFCLKRNTIYCVHIVELFATYLFPVLRWPKCMISSGKWSSIFYSTFHPNRIINISFEYRCTAFAQMLAIKSS